MAKRTALELLNDIAKPQALGKLHAMCNKKLEALAARYPEREAATWPIQIEEAKAYLLDNTAEIPFLTAAVPSDMTLIEYAELVKTNNAAWSTIAGSIVKMRIEAETAIGQTTTEAEVEAVIEGISHY